MWLLASYVIHINLSSRGGAFDGTPLPPIPVTATSLTDTAIRKTKPTAIVPKLRDGGLYLLLRPDSTKWWRWDYRLPVTDKRNTFSLGTCPDVGLATARERHAAARRLLADGVDPGQQRKAQKAATRERLENTFEAVAAELIAVRAKKMSATSPDRQKRLLSKDLGPYIGRIPVDGVTARDLLDAIRRI